MLVDHHDAGSVESVTDHYGVLRTPCLSPNSQAATHQRNYLRSHCNSPIGMVLVWPQDSYHPALHGYC